MSTTLDYFGYVTAPVREEVNRNYIRRSVSRQITTNEYSNISKKKFLSHIHKLKEIAEIKNQSPEIDDAPSREALFFANLVIEQLQRDELAPAKIVESVDGGVAICFVAGDKYADIECLNTGEILGVTTNRRDRPSVWEIKQNASEIARATERIREFICKY